MTDADKHPNPFPKGDPDRYEIWEILMRHDFDAFVASDWSMAAPDFVPSGFFGIDAGKSPDPDQWRLKFPTIELYRQEWLAMAGEFKQAELVGESKLDFLFRVIELNDIDIAGDHAVAHKKFDGSTKTVAGELIEFKWQTLYKMLRVDGEWRIASFVGFMHSGL